MSVLSVTHGMPQVVALKGRDEGPACGNVERAGSVNSGSRALPSFFLSHASKSTVRIYSMGLGGCCFLEGRDSVSQPQFSTPKDVHQL
jgi:hypothetical protein